MKAKHLVTLCLLLWGYCLFSQTPKETLDYLKTYYSELRVATSGETSINYNSIIISGGKVQGSFIVTACVEYTSEEGCTRYDNNEVECNEVKGISLHFRPYKLVSESENRKVTEPESWILKIHYADNQTIILLLHPSDEKYANRFKNAINKLVEYSGAELINEDLFE